VLPWDARTSGLTGTPTPVSLNPCRCHAITVSGLTIRRAERQTGHTLDRANHNTRSWGFSWLLTSGICGELLSKGKVLERNGAAGHEQDAQ
jgi:hypothetical protein